MAQPLRRHHPNGDGQEVAAASYGPSGSDVRPVTVSRRRRSCLGARLRILCGHPLTVVGRFPNLPGGPAVRVTRETLHRIPPCITMHGRSPAKLPVCRDPSAREVSLTAAYRPECCASLSQRLDALQEFVKTRFG